VQPIGLFIPADEYDAPLVLLTEVKNCFPDQEITNAGIWL
jgi:hypothetical protein